MWGLGLGDARGCTGWGRVDVKYRDAGGVGMLMFIA